jgi:hypothetical protein
MVRVFPGAGPRARTTADSFAAGGRYRFFKAGPYGEIELAAEQDPARATAAVERMLAMVFMMVLQASCLLSLKTEFPPWSIPEPVASNQYCCMATRSVVSNNATKQR